MHWHDVAAYEKMVAVAWARSEGDGKCKLAC